MKKFTLTLTSVLVATTLAGCSEAPQQQCGCNQHRSLMTSAHTQPVYTAPVSTNPERMPTEYQGERYYQAPNGDFMSAAAMLAAGYVAGQVAGQAAEYYFDKKRGSYQPVPKAYHSSYWQKTPEEKDKNGNTVRGGGYVINPAHRATVMQETKKYNSSVLASSRTMSSRAASNSSTTVSGGKSMPVSSSARSSVFGATGARAAGMSAGS